MMTNDWIKNLKVRSPVYVETGSFSDRELVKDKVHRIVGNRIELVRSELVFNSRGEQGNMSGWEPLDRLMEWSEKNHARYILQEQKVN